jgi:hypothetical protein
VRDDLKPPFNVELLRGILLAYLAYGSYRFICGFLSWNAPVMITSMQWAGITLGLLVGSVIYTFLLYRVVFHAGRSGKIVFVFLTLVALLSIMSAAYAFIARTPTGGPFSPWPRVVSALVSIGMASIAYLYFRGQQRLKGLTNRSS